MDPFRRLVMRFSERARAGRARLFRDTFPIERTTKILDLGSETGCRINAVIEGTKADPRNVYIADINPEAVAAGAAAFGYRPVVIDESARLPFPDGFFDIVHCSSVIEHVTGPKEQVARIHSGRKFRRLSKERQSEFAREIRRVSRSYFVQTPNRYFPIESHTWLPLVGFLPRELLVPFLSLTNMFWVQKTSPDFNLLDRRQMAGLFDEARIVEEKAFGLTKSILAIFKAP